MKERSRAAIVAAIVTVTLAAATAYRFVAIRAGRGSPDAGPRVSPAMAIPRSVLSAIKPSPDGNGSMPGVQERLTYAGLLRVLKEAATEPELAPVANRFLEEFMSRPELRAAASSFRERSESGHGDGAGARFMTTLARSRDFSDLVASFASDPAIGKLADRLARDPLITSCIREAATPLEPSDAVPETTSDRVREPSGARRETERTPGERYSETGAPSDTPGPEATASEAASGASQAGGRAPEGLSVTDATRLSTVPGVGKTRYLCTAGKCEARDLLNQMQRQDRAKLEPLIDPHGFWGGCFEAGLYRHCRRVCESTPGCIATTPMSACLERKDSSPVQCIMLCVSRGDCG